MQGSIIHLIGSIVTLAGFGIVMGLQASVYGATFDLLARGSKIWRLLLCLVGGLASGVTIMLIVLLLFNPQSYITALSKNIDHIVLNRWVDLVAGTVFVLIAAGIAVWKIRRPTITPKEPKSQKSGAAYGAYFGIGIAAPIIDLTMWPIMFLVSRTVTSVSTHAPVRLLGVAVFLIVLVAPFFLLAWAWSRFPQQTQKITGFYKRALSYDYRWWVVGALTIVGTGIIIWALTR